jgi:hypothetical protein
LNLTRFIARTPANLLKEKKAAARKRENQQGGLGKREKRAAAKTLSVASAHGKADAARESHEATEDTNMIHVTGDGREVGRPCRGRLSDDERMDG